MSNDEYRALLDKDQIREVLGNYCWAADLPDADLMKTLFHPGATDEHAGMFTGKVEELIPQMIERRKLFNAMQHNLSNIRIKLDGDVADTECFVTSTMGYIKGDKQYHWLAGGRYADRFERRNGEWRIAKRVTYMDWSRIVLLDSTLPRPF